MITKKDLVVLCVAYFVMGFGIATIVIILIAQ